MAFALKPFHRDVPESQLLADLADAHKKLVVAGKPLTFRNYQTVGKYSASTFSARFGSWNGALERAGISLRMERNISDEALFDNLRSVWIALGKQPTFRDMRSPPSRYDSTTYGARFGGWRNALEAFAFAFSKDETLVCETVPQHLKRRVRTGRNPNLALKFFVLKRDNFRCLACGKAPATHSGLVLEVDHILAWSKGGETVAGNLQTLCFDCNRGKRTT